MKTLGECMIELALYMEAMGIPSHEPMNDFATVARIVFEDGEEYEAHLAFSRTNATQN